jgi:hypothetical protein
MEKLLTAVDKARQLIAEARSQGECLVPKLVPNAKGYCYITRGRGTRLSAHRFIYETLIGEIPDGKLVRHSCDNRACINPDHLLLGTSYDNSQDMVSRNRQARLGQPSTNTDQLLEALTLQDEGYTLADIAAKQGLSGPSSAADRVRRAKELGL